MRRGEICEGRARLQALFDQPVHGFVYPFGTFDDAVVQAMRDVRRIWQALREVPFTTVFGQNMLARDNPPLRSNGPPLIA
jgi:hypothetical protein